MKLDEAIEHLVWHRGTQAGRLSMMRSRWDRSQRSLEQIRIEEDIALAERTLEALDVVLAKLAESS